MAKTVTSLGLLACAAALLACKEGPTPLGTLDSFTPAWITASWTAGAQGLPNDRIDREPDKFKGSLCPAASVELTNQDGFAGLNIKNRCTITVTYAICATKGSPPQPSGGLAECAEDPFATPLTRFKRIPLNPGDVGDFVNATDELSIQVFYCSDLTTFAAEPARCIG